ncbi:hypothetical protein HZS_8009 [Henneguya salminicola]|nr:hypothetical protein HZS_8009 [Henneguya salminicola]
MINYIVVFNTLGQVRFQKWYIPVSNQAKKIIIQELIEISNELKTKDGEHFFSYKDKNIVHSRNAGLHIMFAIDPDDNELYSLNVMQIWILELNYYFEPVRELDLIFNFDRVEYILNELLIGGEMVETCAREPSSFVRLKDIIPENNP